MTGRQGTGYGHQARASLSRHLEVETYTWDVLPQNLRTAPVEAAIARELTWTSEHLVAARP